MRNLKVIGKALFDVYDNMFVLAVCNLIYVVLAAVPVIFLISVLSTALTEPESAGGAPVLAVVLGALWVLLAGPPGYALAVVLHGVTNFESFSLGDFVRAMRQHARRAWLMGFVSIGGTVLLLVNLVFYGSGALGAWGTVLVPLFLILTLLWLLMQLYLYPVAVITDGGPMRVLRNTAIVVVRHPLLALWTGLVSAILIVASSLLVIPWVMISVALLTALGTRAVRSAVRRDFGQPDDDPLIDEPLPPITAGDNEATPLPYYGWRAGRRERTDDASDQAARDATTRTEG
ncbi:MAG: hypothetical protein IT340_13085 [Chloroflexi bacterium]|nr:hypothetical protein [Chloroflexota bacterium]